MNPRLTLDAEALARHHFTAEHYRAHHTRRPRRFRLDSEGVGLAVEIPAPRVLGEWLSLDLDAYRSGSAGIVARPVGSDEEPVPLDVVALAEDLIQALRDLPERSLDEAPAWHDLRLFAEHGAARFDYAREALQGLRAGLPKVPVAAPSPNVEHAPALSGSERVRRHRERRRAEEDASAAWALAHYLDDEDEAPAPGATVPATVVRDYVRETVEYAVQEWEERVEDPCPGSPESFLTYSERVEEWREGADDEGLPPGRPRIPSARRIYAVAEAHGFTRTRSHGNDRLTIPKEDTSMTATTEALIDRAARILVEEARAEIEAHSRSSVNVETTADLGLNVVPLRRRSA